MVFATAADFMSDEIVQNLSRYSSCVPAYVYKPCNKFLGSPVRIDFIGIRSLPVWSVDRVGADGLSAVQELHRAFALHLPLL